MQSMWINTAKSRLKCFICEGIIYIDSGYMQCFCSESVKICGNKSCVTQHRMKTHGSCQCYWCVKSLDDARIGIGGDIVMMVDNNCYYCRNKPANQDVATAFIQTSKGKYVRGHDPKLGCSFFTWCGPESCCPSPPLEGKSIIWNQQCYYREMDLPRGLKFRQISKECFVSGLLEPLKSLSSIETLSKLEMEDRLFLNHFQSILDSSLVDDIGKDAFSETVFKSDTREARYFERNLPGVIGKFEQMLDVLYQFRKRKNSIFHDRIFDCLPQPLVQIIAGYCSPLELYVTLSKHLCEIIAALVVLKSEVGRDIGFRNVIMSFSIQFVPSTSERSISIICQVISNVSVNVSVHFRIEIK